MILDADKDYDYRPPAPILRIVRLQAVKEGMRVHYCGADDSRNVIELTWSEVEWMMQEFKAATS